MEQNNQLVEAGQENLNHKFNFQEILDTQKRLGRELDITKQYDPGFFWNDFGPRYFELFRKKEQFLKDVPWLIDRLKVLKPKSVLEVGCGFGRILPQLIDAKAAEEVQGIDISESILKSSEKYFAPIEEAQLKQGEEAPKLDFSKIHLQVMDARRMAFESEIFDLVFSCELLQHLSTEDCEQALMEMVRVSKRYVIAMERWAYPHEHSEPHIWSHNIADMLQRLGVHILQTTTVSMGMSGIIAQKR